VAAALMTVPAEALVTAVERGKPVGGWGHEVAAAPMAMLAGALAAATTVALDPAAVLAMATKEGILIEGWSRTTEATTAEKGRLT
jgi:hypothetical protein